MDDKRVKGFPPTHPDTPAPLRSASTEILKFLNIIDFNNIAPLC